MSTDGCENASTANRRSVFRGVETVDRRRELAPSDAAVFMFDKPGLSA